MSGGSPPSTIVVALGGNALIGPGQRGTVSEQFANTRAALQGVYPLIQAGHRLVLTHGNGPQVGTMLIRVEAAEGRVPGRPLGVIVADTEGAMGYMISQSLRNGLILRGTPREVVTILTQVEVDPRDPSLDRPTKPIGPFYSQEQAMHRHQERGWEMVEDSGRGWRRVVPSPAPLRIVESRAIQGLLDQQMVVIAAGGGGIPVSREEDGTLEGVDAVVDKDLASLVLAREIQADLLVILTAVPEVYLDFGRPTQRALRSLTTAEARAHLQAGQFPPGSMGPKIEACIEFVLTSGGRAVITDAENVSDAVEGRAGTVIVP